MCFTARWLLDRPASMTRYANATCTGTEVARVEFAYDGGAFGAAPTAGNQTGRRTKLTVTPTWATTTTTFDRTAARKPPPGRTPPYLGQLGGHRRPPVAPVLRQGRHRCRQHPPRWVHCGQPGTGPDQP